MTEPSLEEAYQASELVCCDIQQQLLELTNHDQRHNLNNSLANAELVRDYLLAVNNAVKQLG